MASVPSKPSALDEDTTHEASGWTHSQQNTRAKSTAIYEDEGKDFGPDPTDEDTIVDRFTVATNLRKKRIEEVLVAIRRARDVQLCFLVDVTGSMQSTINGVRDAIRNIVKSLTAPASQGEGGQPEARSMALAFVAYRDLGNSNHFEVLPFTSNVADFTSFSGRLDANGGFGSTADVFGGLDTALDLRWSDDCGSKAIFHICDAPCHGREFHRPGTYDNYPAGDPKGRTCKGLFSRLRGKGIKYEFGKLNDSTDVMIQKFSDAYGEPIVEFDDVTDVAGITDSVITAVRNTISSSVSASQRTVGVARAVRDYKLDKAEPNWSSIREVKGSFASYEFPARISDIEDDVPLERKKLKAAIVKIANNPFGKGAERLAFYGKDVSTYVEKAKGGANSSSSKSTEAKMPVLTKNEDIVLKEYLHVGKGMNTAKRYELSNQMQTIASYLALQFGNDLKKKTGMSKTIKFIKIRTLYVNSDPARYMSCEKRFAATDKFVRFTNNTDYNIMEAKAMSLGVSMEFVQLVTAFSHWTFKATNKFLMVVDLEGVVGRIGGGGDTGVLLTDPAIHCKDRTRYGPMNHGPGGMKNYFASHVCNQFCKKLGLEGFTC